MLDEDLRRYQQSPREFREAVRKRLPDWRWIFGPHSGSAISKRRKRLEPLDEEVQHLKRLGVALPMLKPKKKTFRRFAAWWETTPIEKGLEGVEHILSNSALLNIVNLIAGFTIILSLATWLWGIRGQRENELFATWTIINDADQDQSGVVRVAVERLYRNGFRLSGLELRGTNLTSADLEGAVLNEANLQGADLSWTNLQETDLRWTNLREADLALSNLRGAVLVGANLQEGYLFGANLQGANLFRADLRGANLREATLQGAEWLTQDQLDQAKLCFTILPDHILLKPNRDCAELGLIPSP